MNFKSDVTHVVSQGLLKQSHMNKNIETVRSLILIYLHSLMSHYFTPVITDPKATLIARPNLTRGF